MSEKSRNAIELLQITEIWVISSCSWKFDVVIGAAERQHSELDLSRERAEKLAVWRNELAKQSGARFREPGCFPCRLHLIIVVATLGSSMVLHVYMESKLNAKRQDVVFLLDSRRAHVQTSPVGCVRVSFKGKQKAADNSTANVGDRRAS
ncbi:hypothetical protein Trydic_g15747 [Trypoxylus dichotomus]